MKAMYKRTVFLLLLCSGGIPGAQAQDDIQAQVLTRLQEVTSIARGGAADLALRIMDLEQPAFVDAPDEWLQWERERIIILRSRKAWPAINARLSNVPDGVSEAFLRWARTTQVQTLLEMGDGALARQAIRDFIWHAESPPAADELSFWRQLLVRAYLADDMLEDAQHTIARYQQDYRSETGEWANLQARLYLRAGRPGDALLVLREYAEPESHVLRLLALLWSGRQSPGTIMEQAVKFGLDQELDESLRYDAWGIAAAAADAIGNQEARIAALERALLLEKPRGTRLIELSSETLWDAYVKFGEAIGNELQLIVGNDEDWFLAASNRFDTQPIHARALFSVVAFKAFNRGRREVAHWQFSSLLNNEAHGGEVLRRLYLFSDRFADAAAIPPQVRYILVNHVLAIPDIPSASNLMAGLRKPPEEADPGEWYLRQARVFLLGGRADEGIQVLQDLLASDYPVSLDRLLQVIFDLQVIERHNEALQFFQVLLSNDLERQQRREILFWTADSLKALGRHEEAGRMYLQSAVLPDPFAMDPWAQTARYHAAESLALAGFTEDAHTLYTGLLNATRDPSRQAVLRNNIQQLMLSSQGREGG